MKKLLMMGSAIGFAAISSSAYAQSNTDSGYLYGNIGVSLLSADLDLDDVDVQGNAVNLGQQSIDATMIFGRLGYRVLPYLAIEGEAGIGLSGDDFTETIPVSTPLGSIPVDANIDAKVSNYAGIFARGILPAGENFDIFARVGYGYAKAEADVTATAAALPGFTASASDSASTSDFAYGVGAEYRFNDRNGVRFDYAHISDADLLSLAYAIRF